VDEVSVPCRGLDGSSFMVLKMLVCGVVVCRNVLSFECCRIVRNESRIRGVSCCQVRSWRIFKKMGPIWSG